MTHTDAPFADGEEKTGFEGAEKRLELDFWPSPSHPRGLRSLSRAQLDEILTQAKCTIVSERHAPAFDAYVLSESSLFVYATKLVIKTCGTTALLIAAPRMLELASSVGLAARRVKYTRACFKFPKLQPFPHRSWNEEVDYLDSLFGYMDDGPHSTTLGKPGRGLMWHSYTAETSRRPCPPSPTSVMTSASMCSLNGAFSSDDEAISGSDMEAEAPVEPITYTLEVCMTELGDAAAAKFFFGAAGTTAVEVTVATGIRDMFPDAVIDDFLFEPCGYSMNALQGAGLMTIHVTPESHCSYASVEISGHSTDAFDPAELLAKAVKSFNPGRIAVALSGDAPAAVKAWAAAPAAPAGMTATGSCAEVLSGGGFVSFATAVKSK